MERNCAFDNSLGVVIHRYPVADIDTTVVCYCGEKSVETLKKDSWKNGGFCCKKTAKSTTIR